MERCSVVARHPLAEQLCHLRVRAIGLALIYEGRGVVDVCGVAVGINASDCCARKVDRGDGSIGANCAIQRIVCCQGDLDLGALAAGAELVQTVVEELTEDSEPAVGWSNAGVFRADEEFSVGGVLVILVA